MENNGIVYPHMHELINCIGSVCLTICAFFKFFWVSFPSISADIFISRMLKIKCLFPHYLLIFGIITPFLSLFMVTRSTIWFQVSLDSTFELSSELFSYFLTPMFRQRRSIVISSMLIFLEIQKWDILISHFYDHYQNSYYIWGSELFKQLPSYILNLPKQTAFLKGGFDHYLTKITICLKD